MALKMAVREGLSRVQAVALRGNGVMCPVCGGTFRHFTGFGDPWRPHAMCPSCRSLERHRLAWIFLQSHTRLFRDPLRVLHIAPEPILMERLRSLPNLDYLTADLNPEKADVQMDICNIEYPDESFDVILCAHVLEHVPNANRAMRELRRVLSPAGFALLDVPMNPALQDTYEDWSITSDEGRRAAFGQFDHVRWFGRNYPDLLREARFHVDVDPFPLSSEKSQRYGISSSDHIYYCTV